MLFQVPLGIDNLVTIDEPTRRKVFESSQRGGGGVNSKTEGGPDGSGNKQKVWGVGEMEFEALMRMLDNAVSFTLLLYLRFVRDHNFTPSFQDHVIMQISVF